MDLSSPLPAHGLSDGPLPSSFRDPRGFVFARDGLLYRQVNACHKDEFERLTSTGLYEALTRDGLLVSHDEVSLDHRLNDLGYKVIKPALLPFVSYPYEWSFGQLKAAALLTLRIQREAIERGMSLKDASGFNVQFDGYAPVFIDTLSFETYREGRPWIAYRQFCQHFLAPLALMSEVDVRLGQLLKTYLDGIPLDLASPLLPFRSRLSLPLYAHIHLHAKAQAKYADKPAKRETLSVSKRSLLGLIDSLQTAVEGLNWTPKGTEWADYYEDTNYAPEAMNRKTDLVAAFLDRVNPHTVWDLGANTGVFTRIASGRGAKAVAFDIDIAAVEKNYRKAVRDRDRNLLPLLLDMNNPSPGLGWESSERSRLADRGPASVVMALALAHHLAIGNNVPLDHIAHGFAALGRHLVIEFVPKEDSQVQRMLASREDIFDGYNEELFRASFARHFTIEDAARIEGSHRTLFLMRSKVLETTT